MAVGGAFQALDDETKGDLKDPKQHEIMLLGAVHSLFLTTRDTANREATCQLIKDMNRLENTEVSALPNKKV